MKNVAHSRATGGGVGEAITATGRQLKFQGQQALQRVSGAPAAAGDIKGTSFAPTSAGRNTVVPGAGAAAATPGQSALSQMYQRGIDQSKATVAGGKPAPAWRSYAGPPPTIAGNPL